MHNYGDLLLFVYIVELGVRLEVEGTGKKTFQLFKEGKKNTKSIKLNLKIFHTRMFVQNF